MRMVDGEGIGLFIQKLDRYVRIRADPRYTYLWKEDGVIRVHKPDMWKVIYAAPDDGIICEQRKRKGVVYIITGRSIYSRRKVRDCLDVWL